MSKTTEYIDKSTPPTTPPTNDLTQSATTTSTSNPEELVETEPIERGFRFWIIIISLMLGTLLSALDLTAISTALPTISHDLNTSDFAWIANSYSITSTAIIPWSSGFAHAIGRRPIMLLGLICFFIGSALCGAAKNLGTMITGRSFQGIGSGIILSLVEIILADLVSLRDRGIFQGLFGATWALASAIGPVIGGSLAQTNWRWLFYLNLPLTAGIALVVGFFLNLKKPEGSIREKLGRMDWFGNLVFIPSITLFIFALLSGGQSYAWDSATVIAPLVIGVVGLIIWYLIERFVADYPTVPFELMTNWTTMLGFFTTLLHSLIALALFYYWPVYFQAVKVQSPVASSVSFFSVVFVVAPLAIIAGATVSILQVYRPQNIVEWILIMIGLGIMTLVHAFSSRSLWAPIPIVLSIRIGLLFAATVFPVLAPLPPSLAGRALAFLVFARNVGSVLGITVGSTVLANELNKKLPIEFLTELQSRGGVAAAYSAIPEIPNLSEPLRTQVQIAFAESIRIIWIVLLPFAFIGLVATLGMKHFELNSVTDEAWGLEHKNSEVRDLEN